MENDHFNLSINRESPGEGQYPENELLQTPFWGGIKARFGWQELYISMTFRGRSYSLLILIRRLSFFFSLAYLPYPSFPWLPGEAERFLKAFSRQVRRILPPGVVFIRFDLPWELSGGLKGDFFLRKSPMDIQPPSTVLLDITPGEEDILKQMKRKCRYNIRLGAKKGVVVKNYGRDLSALEQWYSMYEETARRDKIVLHSLEYYRTIFKAAEKAKGITLSLLIAEAEEEPLAGIVVVFTGKKATYLYGASTNKKRNLMPNHLLQWEGIKAAKAAGCEIYDFFGIPGAEDPSHPMHGLYRFKTGFGGRIVHRPGCYDYPLKPLFYFFFTLLEKGRKFYYKRIRKK